MQDYVMVEFRWMLIVRRVLCLAFGGLVGACVLVGCEAVERAYRNSAGVDAVSRDMSRQRKNPPPETRHRKPPPAPVPMASHWVDNPQPLPARPGSHGPDVADVWRGYVLANVTGGIALGELDLSRVTDDGKYHRVTLRVVSPELIEEHGLDVVTRVRPQVRLATYDRSLGLVLFKDASIAARMEARGEFKGVNRSLWTLYAAGDSDRLAQVNQRPSDHAVFARQSEWRHLALSVQQGRAQTASGRQMQFDQVVDAAGEVYRRWLSLSLAAGPPAPPRTPREAKARPYAIELEKLAVRVERGDGHVLPGVAEQWRETVVRGYIDQLGVALFEQQIKDAVTKARVSGRLDDLQTGINWGGWGDLSRERQEEVMKPYYAIAEEIMAPEIARLDEQLARAPNTIKGLGETYALRESIQQRWYHFMHHPQVAAWRDRLEDTRRRQYRGATEEMLREIGNTRIPDLKGRIADWFPRRLDERLGTSALVAARQAETQRRERYKELLATAPPCTVCKGTATVPKRQLARCAPCGGWGTYALSGICIYCHGKGTAGFYETVYVACDTCRATGKQIPRGY
ncbi:MAG: hypothetical protein AAF750_11920 [Planctomycetota bacterium]